MIKSDEQYQKKENRESIKLKIRQIANRVGDAACLKADNRFDEQLANTGTVLEIGYTDAELRELVNNTSQRMLGDNNK